MVAPDLSIERTCKGRFAPFGPPLMANVRPLVRSPAERYLLWLPAPLLAVAFIALVFAVNGEPGLVFLALAVGGAFLLLAPIIQAVLLATPKFRHQYRSACVLSLLAAFAIVCVPTFLGVFSFW